MFGYSAQASSSACVPGLHVRLRVGAVGEQRLGVDPQHRIPVRDLHHAVDPLGRSRSSSLRRRSRPRSSPGRAPSSRRSHGPATPWRRRRRSPAPRRSRRSTARPRSRGAGYRRRPGRSFELIRCLGFGQIARGDEALRGRVADVDDRRRTRSGPRPPRRRPSSVDGLGDGQVAGRRRGVLTVADTGDAGERGGDQPARRGRSRRRRRGSPAAAARRRRSAPWRIGSSMKRHESAAMANVAAICSSGAKEVGALAPAGVVRTMIGKCQR